MKNFDIARQSYNTAEFGSEGSAEKELSNYQKSIEYHIGQMKASFQELSTSLVNSDIFKGFIDGGTTAINILTKFVGVANGVPAVLTAIGAVKAFKNLDQLKSQLQFTFNLVYPRREYYRNGIINNVGR